MTAKGWSSKEPSGERVSPEGDLYQSLVWIFGEAEIASFHCLQTLGMYSWTSRTGKSERMASRSSGVPKTALHAGVLARWVESSPTTTSRPVESPRESLHFCPYSQHSATSYHTRVAHTLNTSISSAAAACSVVSPSRNLWQICHSCQYIKPKALHTEEVDHTLRTAVSSPAPAGLLGAILRRNVVCG